MQDTFEPLLTHLIELRLRLIRVCVVFLVVFAGCFFFSAQLYDFLAAPLTRVLPHQKLISIGIVSPFLVQMKIAAFVAFLLTLPHTFYQVWAFIAPGLYSHEKRLAMPLIMSSTLLFFLGMAFAYFFVFGTVFHFLAGVVPNSMQWLPDSSQYLDFVIGLFLSFGITFEVPVIVVLLVYTGIVTLDRLREIRRYVIVGAFVLAAILTPPDVLSQLMLAIPLWLLYEVGLGISAFLISLPRSNNSDKN